MEKLTVEIPPESICISHASCPNGHSLMDPSHPMGRVPSIRVRVVGEEGEGILHLNAWYGNFETHSELPLAEGKVYELSCPECGVSLQSDEERCIFCSAQMFVLHLPKGGLVQGCQRMGCHNHKLKVVDLSAQLGEFLNQEIKPRF